jgi:hypothetical protein
LWLEEFVGFLVAPLIMILSLPQCADEIIAFFGDKTVDMKGIGPVCQYARFDISVANIAMFGTESFIRPRTNLSPGLDDKGKLSDAGMVVLEEETVSSDDQIVSVTPEKESRALRHSLTIHPETNNGKMEMSLVNFKMKNKKWKPSDNDERIHFVTSLSNSTQMLRRSAGFGASFLAPPTSLSSTSPRALQPNIGPSASSSSSYSPQIVVDIVPEEYDEDMLQQSLIYKAFERRDAGGIPGAPQGGAVQPRKRKSSSSGFS